MQLHRDETHVREFVGKSTFSGMGIVSGLKATQGLTPSAISTLLSLATQCEEEGMYDGSMKCLLAILSADPLPDVMIRASAMLADLYTNHTHNIVDAKQLMHQVVCFPNCLFLNHEAHCDYIMKLKSTSLFCVLFLHSMGTLGVKLSEFIRNC